MTYKIWKQQMTHPAYEVTDGMRRIQPTMEARAFARAILAMSQGIARDAPCAPTPEWVEVLGEIRDLAHRLEDIANKDIKRRIKIMQRDIIKGEWDD